MPNNILDLKDKLAKAGGLLAPKGNCVSCKQPFSNINVFSDAGWRETEISQMCEKCFDQMFADMSEEE